MIMRDRLLLFAFLLSGAAALGYEILWTRLLSLALGSETLGVLGTLAGFFGGLALGSWWLHERALRAENPVRLFAALESIAAVYALVSPHLLHALIQHLPIWLGPMAGDNDSALALLCSLVAATLVMLPGTLAMGATLAALVEARRRACPDEAEGIGLGRLYAANTLGATLGTLGAVFVVLPRLGLVLGSVALAGLGLASASLALAWARDRELGPPSEESRLEKPVGMEDRTARAKKAKKKTKRKQGGKVASRLTRPWIYGILAFTGLAGVGLEVVGLQVMTQLLQNTVYTFANLLAVYLVGTASGAWFYARWAAGRTAERAPAPMAAWLLWAHVPAVGIAAWVLRSSPDWFERLAPATATQGQHLLAELTLAAVVFLVPTILMGALFSHLTSLVAARGVGRAYALNTLGATLAPFVFGLGAIRLTSYATALELVGWLYLGIFIVTAMAARLRRGTMVAATAVGIVICLFMPASLRLVSAEEGWREIATREGLMGLVMVTELEGSDAPGRNLFRRLQVNEHFRMGGSVSFGEQRMGHIPLLFAPEARRALFLGVGTGATLGAVRHYPSLEEIDAVELVPSVLDFLPLFEHVNEGVADDPRIRFHTADARRFVAASTERYDLVIGDLFHPGRDGAGSLFSYEHFRGVREHLAPGGIYAQWLPLYQFDIPNLRTVVRTFLDVYPEVHSFLGIYNAMTPAMVLMGRAEPGEAWISRDRLEQRLRDPVYQRLLMNDPREMMAAYMLDRDALAAFAGDGPRNTDLHPRVLFDAPRHTAYEADLHEINWGSFEALLDHRTLYPPSFLGDDDGLAMEVEGFSRALTLHLRGEIGRARNRGRVTPDLLDLHLAAYAEAPELMVVSGYLLSFARNNPGASEQILESMLESTPDDPAIWGEYVGFLHWRKDPRFLRVLGEAQERFGKETFPDP